MVGGLGAAVGYGAYELTHSSPEIKIVPIVVSTTSTPQSDGNWPSPSPPPREQTRDWRATTPPPPPSQRSSTNHRDWRTPTPTPQPLPREQTIPYCRRNCYTPLTTAPPPPPRSNARDWRTPTPTPQPPPFQSRTGANNNNNNNRIGNSNRYRRDLDFVMANFVDWGLKSEQLNAVDEELEFLKTYLAKNNSDRGNFEFALFIFIHLTFQNI